MATIFLGLGGSGVNTIQKIKEKYDHFDFTRIDGQKSRVIFAGIDIDLPSSDVSQSIQFLPVQEPNPRQIIDNHLRNDSLFRKWWIKGYYPETPLVNGMGAGRYRLNGRLIFWQNFDRIQDFITSLMNQANAIDPALGAQRHHTMYLVTSIAGGTGSGLLIETGFLARSLINAGNWSLQAFVYHGNIFEKANIPEARKVSCGVLTELERWMERPEDYSMRYSNAELGGFQQFLNMIYIIDEANMDDRTFVAKGNANILDQYVEFGAWQLFALSMEDIDLQNTIADFAGLPVSTGGRERSRRYGSLSVSVVSIPYEEISNWLIGSFITNLKDGFWTVDETNPGKILKDLNLYEQDASQLSKHLKDAEEYRSAMNYVLSIKADLENSESKDKFMDNIINYELNDMHKIKAQLAKWESFIDAQIISFQQKFRDQLDEKIDNILEETLNFGQIEGYLASLRTMLGNQKVQVEKNHAIKQSSNEILDLLKEQVSEIESIKSGAFNKLFKKNEFRQFADEWVSISGFNNPEKSGTYIQARTAEILMSRETHLYDILAKMVESKIKLIEPLKEVYIQLIEYYKKIQDSYHDDKSSLLDTERLQKQEFPLEIKIPVSRDDLVQVRNKLVKDEDLRKSLRTSIWAGRGEEIIGFQDLVKHVHTDIAEAGGKNRDSIISVGVENLKKLIKEKLAIEFRNEINESFRVDKALRKFYEHKYAEYKKIEQHPEERVKFERELGFQVGVQTLGDLKNRKLTEEEWVDKAMNGFLGNLAQLVSPFWKLQNLGKFHTDYYIEDLNRYPAKEHARIYMHPDLDIPKDGLGAVNNLDSDSYRIFILSYSHGCPLYLLNAVKGANYLLYNPAQQISKRPFSDARFLDDWKDNIEQEKSLMLNDFLFIMAIGLGIIHRTMKGKAKAKTYYWGDVNLGSITEAAYKAGRELKDNIEQEVKREVAQKILLLTDADERKNAYHSILYNAENELRVTKPPKNTKGGATAYNIWKQLYDNVRINRDSKGEVIEQTGKFYKQSASEVAQVIKEHTGLDLSV